MKTISPPVIYYHSVAPQVIESWSRKYLTIQLQTFEEQMKYLKNNHFRFIFLDEWLAIRKGEQQSRGNEICVTFDDGYLDNWVYVFPIIKKHRIRMTLFVAPECVDDKEIIRPNFEDVWNGKNKKNDLDDRGYLTWNELLEMHNSQLVDIQSHTMSHDKYVASNQIKKYYYGGPSGVYPIWNKNPKIKPTYMADEKFETRLPFGTPIFEDQSAVIVRKHKINSDYLNEVNELAGKFQLEKNENRFLFEEKANELYDDYFSKNKIIQNIESESEYQKRLHYEIVESKKILESKFKKSAEFLCWPHGDNTLEAHQLAMNEGYKATTSGKLITEARHENRIPRIGTVSKKNRWLGRLKFHYKILSHLKKQPYYSLWKANELKNKLF